MPNEQKVSRKLRAILSADVKGYSLLMTDDEVHTIQTLKAYRSLMSDLIQQHSGRVVDNPGDNLLAEFSSAVDAVEAAVQIQNMLKNENAKFVDDKRVQFRIGVNIGDVVHDDDRIYGEGVNIAARIESLADAGGVCVSRNTYDQIKNKLKLDTEYLGEHEVKNIKEPVRVYKVLMGPEPTKSLVNEYLELPDKPSIAVLPFNNMSGDPSQEYFSDGLTEQIINGLCKISNLFVIGRNSSFAYKGKLISNKKIAQELGVRYILEGSVQKAGDRIRITAQLIDAITDYHMWSENYDRDLSDIFALQDEIAIKLMAIMQIKLTMGEQSRLWGTGTSNIQAYDRLAQGSDYIIRQNEKDNKQARQYYREAINIDDTYDMAYVHLGYTHILDLFYGWGESTIKSFEQAEANVVKALALNDSLDMAHNLLGWIYLLKRQYDEAIKEGERAIELSPNGAEAHVNLAFILNFSGKIELAMKLLNRAFRLNPIPPPHFYIILSATYRNNGQYEKAIDCAEKGLSGNPDILPLYLTLAASYTYLNRTEEANKAVKEILRIDPDFSLEYYALAHFFLGHNYYQMGVMNKSQIQHSQAVEILEDIQCLPSLVNLCRICIWLTKDKQLDKSILYQLENYASSNGLKVFEGWMFREICNLTISSDSYSAIEAVQWAKKAIQSDERNGLQWQLAKDYTLYSKILELLGQKEQASQNLRKAKKINALCQVS